VVWTKSTKLKIQTESNRKSIRLCDGFEPIRMLDDVFIAIKLNRYGVSQYF